MGGGPPRGRRVHVLVDDAEAPAGPSAESTLALALRASRRPPKTNAPALHGRQVSRAEPCCRCCPYGFGGRPMRPITTTPCKREPAGTTQCTVLVGGWSGSPVARKRVASRARAPYRDAGGLQPSDGEMRRIDLPSPGCLMYPVGERTCGPGPLQPSRRIDVAHILRRTTLGSTGGRHRPSSTVWPLLRSPNCGRTALRRWVTDVDGFWAQAVFPPPRACGGRKTNRARDVLLCEIRHDPMFQGTG